MGTIGEPAAAPGIDGTAGVIFTTDPPGEGCTQRVAIGDVPHVCRFLVWRVGVPADIADPCRSDPPLPRLDRIDGAASSLTTSPVVSCPCGKVTGRLKGGRWVTR